MNPTAQILLGTLTILGSGVVSAIVTYRLNADKAKREFKREKLEALFQAIHSYSRTVRIATVSRPLVIRGQASAKLAIEIQTKHYLDSPDDIDRCILLVALYFRELEPDLQMLKQAATDLHSFIEQLAKKEQAPAGHQECLEDFYRHLDRFVKKEAAMKLSISEMARKYR